MRLDDAGSRLIVYDLRCMWSPGTKRTHLRRLYPMMCPLHLGDEVNLPGWALRPYMYQI
jgi:hypothetical protein